MGQQGDIVAGIVSDKPFIKMDKPLVDFTKGRHVSFTLFPSVNVLEDDHFLVIDIYSASNHVHPEGHVGWWKRDLEEGVDISVKITRTNAGINVSFPRYKGSVEHWTNWDMFSGLDQPILAVHVVLRSKKSQAITFNEIMPVYVSSEALGHARRQQEALRSDFQSIHNAAMPWFHWPKEISAHVVTASFREHDAVGSFVLGLYRLLARSGVTANIYADHCRPELRGFIKPMPDLITGVGEEDLIFFNFSIFDHYVDTISLMPCRKILYYHSITPPRYSQVYDPELARFCHKGCEQLPRAGRFDKLMANSRASARELWSALASGLKNNGEHDSGLRHSVEAISICPPFVGPQPFAHVDPRPLDLPLKNTRLLYVGRVAQHKKIEDLVALFQEYHNLDQDSCLLIVGIHLMPGYSAYLRHVLDTRFQRVKDSIFFLGEVSLGQLESLYRACSAFVTMSEHEGFCLPVVEAMSFDLPVFAYAEPAVRETLGGSGVIYYSKDFSVIAEDIHRILHSTNELAHMLASQRRRVEEIEHEANGHALWMAFEEVLFTK